MPESPPPAKDQLEFAWKVHGYTNEYVRFADPKAGIGLAIVAGLVATLFNAKAHYYCSPLRFRVTDIDAQASFVGWTTTLSFGLLLGAGVTFIIAVSPRLWKVALKDRSAPRSADALPTQPTIPTEVAGHVFWGSVQNHPTSDAFYASVSALSEEAKLKEVTHQIYVLAAIADRKYRLVTRGIWLGAAGAAFAVLALFVLRG